MSFLPPSPDTGAPSPVAIGDLQGCRDALDNLLEKIDRSDQAGHAQSSAPAPLWFAGDLVNRGPDSLGTLRRLIGLGARVTAILGNHDLHLLGVAAGVRTLKKNDTLTDILEAPDAEALLDWVRHRPLAHFADGMLMVHAGVLPQWDVDATLAHAREIETGLRSDDWRAFVARLFSGDGTAWHPDLTGDTRLRVIANALTRLRFCNADGVMEWKANGGLDSALPGFMPWFDVPGRRTADVTVIFGHWAALGLIRRDRLYGLDSGCVWGNALSAIRLTPDPATRELFQVPCAKRPAPVPLALSQKSP
ncbi:MAG: symmetrical bis(5'-nucleosyl)-tetraphosphatase [Janthinobacterium lividum]